MKGGDLQSGEVGSEGEEGLAEIGVYASSRKAHEAGLAVLAAGHHYRVDRKQGHYVLVVPGEHRDLLRREVEIAEIRNRFWPPPSLELPSRSISKFPTAVAVSLLCLIFYLQQEFRVLTDLGMNSVQAVAAGQWWRLVTAISLHADIGHLAGNLLGFVVFAYLSCRYMGNGLAWLSILFSAALSNLTNVYMHWGEVYQSLGASTAVFAALGLLTGFPIGSYFRSREPILSRDWLIPFVGGCFLFAWMGGGEYPTDVGGHLWSFFYGLISAVLIASTAFYTKLNHRHQSAGLFAAGLVVLVCWILALGSGQPP